MLAVAGTHGKTTTTALLIYAFTRLGIPVSYLIGTTLGWGRGGNYSTDAKYFIYEADEYDRNFLAYHPFVVLRVQCEALQGEWRFFEERSSASCFRSQCQRSRQFSRFKLIVFGGGVEPREDFQEVQTFFAGLKVLGSRMIHRQR